MTLFKGYSKLYAGQHHQNYHIWNDFESSTFKLVDLGRDEYVSI